MAPATRASRNTPLKALKAEENCVTPGKTVTPRKVTTPARPNNRFGAVNSPIRIQTPFNLVKKVLTGSAPDTLVGRDEEYKKISSLIKSSLVEKKSLAIYVSGGPGTGKTLTVNHVIENIKMNYDFKCLTINCMHIESLKDFYQHFISQFGSSPKKTKKQTLNEDNDEILKIEEILKHQKQMTILILDEIDQLKSSTNEALQRIFTLPNNVQNKVILIGISNLLDFTSKMAWLNEFKKSTFHDLKFLPYNKNQIVEIIDQRLQNAGNDENNIVDKFAIEYCARKISACSGDIRKALDVCRRAVELVEGQNRRSTPVKNALTPLKKRLFDDNFTLEATEAPKPQPQQRVDVKTMMNALNKVYGGVIDKLDDDKKVFLPSDQQLILAVMLILRKIKKLRDVKLSELRFYISKICSKRNISGDNKSDSDLLTLSRLLAQHGYLAVVNDDQSSAGTGTRSPAKRTPTKKKLIHISLKLEPSEIEQLLGAFYKNILNDAETLLST